MKKPQKQLTEQAKERLRQEAMCKTEELLEDEAAIRYVYQQILDNERPMFPDYMWSLPHSRYYAKVITWHLIEDVLGWSIEEAKTKFTLKTIGEYRLHGMYLALFDSVYDILNHAYPNEMKPWERDMVPKGYWKSDDNRRTALRWLFQEKLQWDMEQIKANISVATFAEHGMNGLLQQFGNSPYRAVDFLYPGQIQAGELASTRSQHWACEQNRREAFLHMIEEELQWSLEEAKKQLCFKVCKAHGLGHLFTKYFHSSSYNVLHFLYPNQVKPWEMMRVPKNFWNEDDHRREALLWLFEEKLNWTPAMIDQKLTWATLQKHQLQGLARHFAQSPYLIASFVYPHEEFPRLKRRRDLYRNNRKNQENFKSKQHA